MQTPHKHKKEKEKKLVGKERQQKEAKYTSIYTKKKKKVKNVDENFYCICWNAVLYNQVILKITVARDREQNNPKAKWKSLFFSKELFFGQSLVYE